MDVPLNQIEVETANDAILEANQGMNDWFLFNQVFRALARQHLACPGLILVKLTTEFSISACLFFFVAVRWRALPTREGLEPRWWDRTGQDWLEQEQDLP